MSARLSIKVVSICGSEKRRRASFRVIVVSALAGGSTTGFPLAVQPIFGYRIVHKPGCEVLVSSGTPLVTLMVGRHRHLDPLRADPARLARLGIELRAPSGPASGEFPGMVARRTYDFCELAAATFLQARAHGYPLVLVPVTVVARPQHDALVFGPGVSGGLTGARIAIRSYGQTTGVWVRGMLREHSGVTDVTWVTTSPDHVPDVTYPPNVTRMAGARVVELLRAGAARAAVIGPEDMADDLRCVFGDPVAADREWVARHGVVPVNHLLV